MNTQVHKCSVLDLQKNAPESFHLIRVEAPFDITQYTEIKKIHRIT